VDYWLTQMRMLQKRERVAKQLHELIIELHEGKSHRMESYGRMYGAIFGVMVIATICWVAALAAGGFMPTRMDTPKTPRSLLVMASLVFCGCIAMAVVVRLGARTARIRSALSDFDGYMRRRQEKSTI
jgi:drug/metabolite transporter superfamily protein YnfA